MQNEITLSSVSQRIDFQIMQRQRNAEKGRVPVKPNQRRCAGRIYETCDSPNRCIEVSARKYCHGELQRNQKNGKIIFYRGARLFIFRLILADHFLYFFRSLISLKIKSVAIFKPHTKMLRVCTFSQFFIRNAIR